MDLTQYSLLEETDLIEAERRSLLIDYVGHMTQIYASAGVNEHSQQLIKRLQSVYFVGFEEAEKKKTERVAQELTELATKVFTVTPGRRGAPFRLDMGDA